MDIIKEFDSKAAELLSAFKETLAGIRGGRPSAKLVEDISIDYLGQQMKVKQLGSITILPPREIQVSVWDPQMAAAVGSAIEQMIKVSARAEGNTVRVSLPPLSDERRAELIKLVKREAEETKIKIRTLRDEILKKIKAQADEKKITEDDKFLLKEKIDKISHTTGETIESFIASKVTELNE